MECITAFTIIPFIFEKSVYAEGGKESLFTFL